jgi:cysteine dioxygenase
VNLHSIVAHHASALAARAQFRPGPDYHRELIERTDRGELWLLSWLPGQVTPIHDHGGATSTAEVLTGEWLEERFERRGCSVARVGSVRVRRGDREELGVDVIHRVAPLVPTVSLHLYLPGCFESVTYREAA